MKNKNQELEQAYKNGYEDAKKDILAKYDLIDIDQMCEDVAKEYEER